MASKPELGIVVRRLVSLRVGDYRTAKRPGGTDAIWIANGYDASCDPESEQLAPEVRQNPVAWQLAVLKDLVAPKPRRWSG